MESKFIAIIVAVVVVIAGVGIFFAMKDNGNGEDHSMTGYIIWEAQYSVGLEKDYVGLELTNNLFAGHTCCIIGTSNNYAVNNAETLETFLYGYSQAVDRINNALADKSSENYQTLLNIALNRVAMPDSMTDEQKKSAIENALGNVTYLYADDTLGNLTKLKSDVSSLAKSLYEGKQITKSCTDLGFDSYDALANKFVDDTYMKVAAKMDGTPLSEKKTINIAAIKGDIHQIGIWYAKDTGLFDGLNLNVNVEAQSNGPAVYTQLSNKEADIGLLGAPPMTIRSMNGEDIKAGSAPNEGLSIVGRINSEGSGILLKPGEVASDYITVQTETPGLGAKYIKNGDKYYVFNVEKWGGKIFATPGPATIQHVQLSQLANLMGLKYASYIDGTSLSNDTLYYVAGVASFADFDSRLH